MMDDDWFDDSESLYPDGMDGPTIEPPSVSAPDATGDVFQRSPIARLFLLHVVVWNAVVLLVSLGAMLVYFRNDWTTGGRLLLAGGILTLYGLYRWPRGTDDDAGDAADAADGSAESAGLGEDETDGETTADTDVTESLAADEPAVDS
jgi:hypothetical protein